MPAAPIQTQSLTLTPQTREQVCAALEQMPPGQRKEVSATWLALLETSGPCDPWIHGFSMVERRSGRIIGQCGFKGPPTAKGIVEIAYGVDAEHQGQGYATEAAAALVKFAFESRRVRVVCAHTLPEPNASTRVLSKCGFTKVGEVIDPDDGVVWRWELEKDASHPSGQSQAR
jgi:RimJ/RimL family protein N-acetyltransferase